MSFSKVPINKFFDGPEKCHKKKKCHKHVKYVLLNSTNIPFYSTGRFLGWQVFTSVLTQTIPANNVRVNNGDRIAIFLAGSNGGNTVLGQTLQSFGVYQQVLALQYDVLVTNEASAMFIASQLDPLLKLKHLEIDIYAFSLGGYISRYLLETLGYGSKCQIKNVMLIGVSSESTRFNSNDISDPDASLVNNLYLGAIWGITVANGLYANTPTLAQRLSALQKFSGTYTNKWIDAKLPGVDPFTTKLDLTSVKNEVKENLKYYLANGYIDKGVVTTGILTVLLTASGVGPTVGTTYGNNDPYGWIAQNLYNITDSATLSKVIGYQTTMPDLGSLFDFVADRYLILPSSVLHLDHVTNVAITSGGNYTVAPTTVTFSPPPLSGGIQATGTLSTSTGVVSIAITNGGFGYTQDNPPTIVFNNSGTGGTNASAVPIINSSGVVTGVTIINPGFGYTSAPTILFVNGSGSGATGTTSIGIVLNSIIVTNPGEGYVALPDITISGGTGTQGTARVVNHFTAINDVLALSSNTELGNALTEKSNFFVEHPYPAQTLLPYFHTALPGSGMAVPMDNVLRTYYYNMVTKFFSY